MFPIEFINQTLVLKVSHDIGLLAPDFCRVHGDADGAGGRGSAVRGGNAQGEDGAGVERPGQQGLVGSLVIQDEGDRTGLEIGDPFLRIAVHQPGVAGFQEQHPVGVGGQEIRRNLQPDAGVFQHAVEPDRHAHACFHNDHLFVAVNRARETRCREFDRMDSHRVAAGMDKQGFRRVAVGPFIQHLPLGVGYLQDEIVRIRDLRRGGPGSGPVVLDDPPQFPLTGGPESEVVTCAQCRRQRQERPPFLESHNHEF